MTKEKLMILTEINREIDAINAAIYSIQQEPLKLTPHYLYYNFASIPTKSAEDFAQALIYELSARKEMLQIEFDKG